MRIVLLLFAFVLSTPVGAETVPDAPDLVATVATRNDTAMRMTVPVTIAGRGPFHFVVDTGSDRTVVSQEVATLLKLAAGETVTMH